MPRNLVFFSQKGQPNLKVFENVEEGLYVIVGDYTSFGIHLSLNQRNRYVISPKSTIPEYVSLCFFFPDILILIFLFITVN